MEKLKNISKYILSFLIPFIILIIIFYVKGFFSDPELFSVSDIRAQHMVFYNYLKDILEGNASIYYSYFAGMGSSMISTIIFYCISPINILVILFKDLITSIFFIYIIKLSLSGLTMYIYLKSKLKNKEEKLITLVFSTLFALSDFFANYFFCIFWLDTIYLAPLVLMGIDKIIEKNKFSLLYILTLSIAIICNIQIGFGLCIFTLIYFIYNLLLKYDIKEEIKKKRNIIKRVSIIYIVSSILGAAIASGCLFGFLNDYTKISAAREMLNGDYVRVTNPLYIIKNLFSLGNITDTYYNNYEPFIYCGLIITFLSILYFFNKNISKKAKKLTLLVIAIFFISFSIRFLNHLWHMSTPTLLNFRYSIYLSMFLILIAQENYYNLDNINKNKIIILIISGIVGLFGCIAYVDNVDLVLTFIYLILVIAALTFAINKRKIFEYILLILILSEAIINYNITLHLADEVYGYETYSNKKTYDKLCKNVSTDNTYRNIYNYSYTSLLNDSILCNNTSSLRYFSSTIDGNLIRFFKRIGTPQGNNNYKYSIGDTPITGTLLGTKYIYSPSNFTGNYYNVIDEQEVTNFDYKKMESYKQKIYTLENPHSLSIGYMIDKDVKYKEGMNQFDFQNAILKSFTSNDKEIAYKLDYELDKENSICKNKMNSKDIASCHTYEVNTKGNNITYLWIDRLYGYEGDDKVIDIYTDIGVIATVKSKGSSYKIGVQYSENIIPTAMTAYAYNQQEFIKDIEKLQENQIENVKINKNILKGTINSNKDGILFLSIPYDKNFNIYIDGTKTKYYKVLDDMFIGLDLKKGNHLIKLEYVDKKVILYITLTIVFTIISFITVFITNKILTNKDKKYEEEQKLIQEQIELNKKLKKEKKEKQKQQLNNKNYKKKKHR